MLTALLVSETYVSVLFTTGRTVASFNTIYLVTLGERPTSVIVLASWIASFGGMCAFMDMGGSIVRSLLLDWPSPQCQSLELHLLDQVSLQPRQLVSVLN